jgi:hypothetical protein
MTATLSQSQSQRISDGELYFSGRRNIYPRQVFFFCFEDGDDSRLLPYSISGQMHQTECSDQLNFSFVSHFLSCSYQKPSSA